MGTSCTGTHRYFVAESAASEGKIFIFIVCTACGEAKMEKFEVASEGATIVLDKNTK